MDHHAWTCLKKFFLEYVLLKHLNFDTARKRRDEWFKIVWKWPGLVFSAVAGRKWPWLHVFIKAKVPSNVFNFSHYILLLFAYYFQQVGKVTLTFSNSGWRHWPGPSHEALRVDWDSAWIPCWLDDMTVPWQPLTLLTAPPSDARNLLTVAGTVSWCLFKITSFEKMHRNLF